MLTPVLRIVVYDRLGQKFANTLALPTLRRSLKRSERPLKFNEARMKKKAGWAAQSSVLFNRICYDCEFDRIGRLTTRKFLHSPCSQYIVAPEKASIPCSDRPGVFTGKFLVRIAFLTAEFFVSLFEQKDHRKAGRYSHCF